MSRVRFLAITAARLSQTVSTRFKSSFTDTATPLAPLLFMLSLPILLVGCDAQNQSDTVPIAEPTTISTHKIGDAVSVSKTADADDSATTATLSPEPHGKLQTGQAGPAELSQTVPPSTRDHPVQIDWMQIDSKVAPVAVDTFHYPLAIDSAPVKAYADFAKVTPKQAQHTLTVSTASNEAVVKLLDQLGDSYVSHKVTDDGGQLIVYTTPNVSASHFDYVLADEFARGLVLPIEIQPQPQ